MIPIKYLENMGEYSIIVAGTAVKVNVVDDPVVMKKHLKKQEEAVRGSKIQVVGLDIPYDNLVLYAGGRCLIIHCLDATMLPKQVNDFLLDERICFVKTGEDVLTIGGIDVGVKVEELAARVLKTPTLMELSLAKIAQEVGVPYVADVKHTFELDRINVRVMTQYQVRFAVRNADACYRIGFKLLSSVVKVTQPDSLFGETWAETLAIVSVPLFVTILFLSFMASLGGILYYFS